MPLYRKHRSTLSESLKTTVIVKNLYDLRDFIYEDWKMWEGALKKDGQPFTKHSFDIKLERYGEMDDRCGWHTHIVSADLEETGKFMAIGFLSEPLE